MKQSYVFSFRKMKAGQLAEVIAAVDAPESVVREQFETIEDGASVRRKSVTVELDVPEFAAQLPELARDVIVGYVAQFVKAQYIDNFAAVGSHTWADIEKYAAERSVGGRRAQFDISEEVLKAAAASIANFVTAGTGKKLVGEKFGKAVEQKFSQSAIKRNIGEVTGELLDKLNGWCERWLEHVASVDPDNAEDFADVFSMLVSKIDSIRGMDVTNVADAL